MAHFGAANNGFGSVPLTELGHINQTPSGPVTALKDLGHLNQTITGAVVALADLGHIRTTTRPVVSLGHINRTTTGPFVSCHVKNSAIIFKAGPGWQTAYHANRANLTWSGPHLSAVWQISANKDDPNIMFNEKINVFLVVNVHFSNILWYFWTITITKSGFNCWKNQRNVIRLSFCLWEQFKILVM